MSTMKSCPKCAAEMRDELVFCTKCGTKLPSLESSAFEEPVSQQDEVYCAQCDETYTDGSLFCRKCGSKLVPVPEPVFLYKECPGCSRKFEDDSVFCNMCGIKLVDVYDKVVSTESNVFVCPGCKKEFTDGSLFCTDCGLKLDLRKKNGGSAEKKDGSDSTSSAGVKLYCDKCGRQVLKGQTRCFGCNSILDDSNVVTFKISDE